MPETEARARDAKAWPVRPLGVSFRRSSGGSNSCGHQVGIEHPNLLPIGFLFLDEFEVSRFGLVDIVRFSAFENDIDRHVVAEVIDRSGQGTVESTDGKIHGSGVPGQVLVASCNQFLHLGGRGVVEGEVNHVRQLLFR